MAAQNDDRRPRARAANTSNTNSTIVRRIAGRWVVTHWPSPDPARRGRVLVAGRDAGRVLMQYGLHPAWNGMRKGWVLDDDRLSDVAAIASMKMLGYRLVHLDGGDCRCVVAPREHRRLEVDPSEESCGCTDLAPLPAELVDLLGAVELAHEHREVA